MCVVSNIGDNYRDNFEKRWPEIWPSVKPGNPIAPFLPAPITRQEFDALKNEVEELKKLLEAAQRFDVATGQEDCHMDEKVELIKNLAKPVGVSVDDIFRAKGE